MEKRMIIPLLLNLLYVALDYLVAH